MSSQLLRLNAFRGEPASSGFEWHFIPNHNSSVDSSTSVSLDLHLVSPKLHPATAYESPAHSSTGTRSEPWAPPTAWELTVSCSISLPDGNFAVITRDLEVKVSMLQGPVGFVLELNRNLRIYAYLQLPKHFIAYYALPRLWVHRILGVPRSQLQETRNRRASSFPPFPPELFGAVLKNDDFPSRPLLPKPEERQLNAFHLLKGFYGRWSRDPGCRRRLGVISYSYGVENDWVVHGFAFLLPHFGSKG
ncbi:hypothetical protein Tco_1277699 [Tanacetum coccineum]